MFSLLNCYFQQRSGVLTPLKYYLQKLSNVLSQLNWYFKQRSDVFSLQMLFLIFATVIVRTVICLDAWAQSSLCLKTASLSIKMQAMDEVPIISEYRRLINIASNTYKAYSVLCIIMKSVVSWVIARVIEGDSSGSQPPMLVLLSCFCLVGESFIFTVMYRVMLSRPFCTWCIRLEKGIYGVASGIYAQHYMQQAPRELPFVWRQLIAEWKQPRLELCFCPHKKGTFYFIFMCDAHVGNKWWCVHYLFSNVIDMCERLPFVNLIVAI
jgi:hypothetical protein